jgi:hypothetical protein
MTPTELTAMMQREVEHRLQLMMDREIEEAKKRIEKAVRSELGNIAVSLLSNYNVTQNGRELVIRVVNKTSTGFTMAP